MLTADEVSILGQTFIILIWSSTYQYSLNMFYLLYKAPSAAVMQEWCAVADPVQEKRAIRMEKVNQGQEYSPYKNECFITI